MLSIDGAALEEWIIERKNLLMVLFLIVGVFAVIVFVFHHPLKRYYFCLREIENLKERIFQGKRANLERLIVSDELECKIENERGTETSARSERSGSSGASVRSGWAKKPGSSVTSVRSEGVEKPGNSGTSVRSEGAEKPRSSVTSVRSERAEKPRSSKIRERSVKPGNSEKSERFESSEILVGESNSTAGWLSDYLGVCGVFQYGFSEEKKVPLGGQGWPIFSVLMDLYYPQAVCVLHQFSQHSVNWRLNELNLSQDNHQLKLKMKMDISVLR